MKIQDIIFFIVFALLLFKRDPKLMVIVGLVSLLLSIPLFSFWIFFTAERLTWYAAAFFLTAIIFHFWKIKKANSS